MSPESERRGPGTPSGLDVVRLRLADDGLVIAPGGRGPDEGGAGSGGGGDLVRPALPVDGGELVCDPGIADPAAAGCMSARVLAAEVPQWVGLVYGPDVARAARELLAGSAGGADGPARTVRTTWFTRPSPAAWTLLRIAQGLWMRRYWPTPVARPVPAPDPFLLDLELGALMQAEPVPACFGTDVMELLVYGPHRDRIRGAAEQLRDHGAPDVLARRLHILLRRALAWLIARIEDNDGEGVGAGADSGTGADDIGALWALYDDLGGLPRPVSESYYASTARGPARDGGAPRAAAGPEGEWGGGAPVRHGVDTLDWSQNLHGLLDTGDGAVRWFVAPADDGRLRLEVSAPLAERLVRDTEGVRALARVPIPAGLPVLVELAPDETGTRLTGWAAVSADEARVVDTVDVVSAPGGRGPLRGAARERMRATQREAAAWARRRAGTVRRQGGADPEGSPWDRPVPRRIPSGLDLSMPWAAEVAAVVGTPLRS
ncbi:hypothetical protein OHJ16_13085 [Actinomyces israelii]|uniref:Uncharacterized protein n=1 Tax=Actinomyces israelii TaxID=1659 RepID=A0ABT4IB61_9ACTO|nr:hypothetical protein [Actinomyces israelii]MCZ0858974.1 hypothetical protein [Actinomyces israelii]